METVAEFWTKIEADPYFKFLQQVDWSEPFLVTLMFIHFLMLVSLVLFRRYHTLIMVILAASTLGVLNAQKLNEWAGLYWYTFSKRNYFDVHGFFITVTVSLPLLLNCVVAATMMVWQAGKLLIQVKKAQATRKSGKKTQ